MAGVRQFDEAAMIETALDLFWRQGLAATSMPDLAQATGIQRGSLYNAYGDKETIFLRSFDLYAERFLQAAQSSLQADDAETALLGFFNAAIDNMTAGAPSRGCLTTKTAGDGSLDSPCIRDRLRAFLDALIGIVEAALDRPEIRPQLGIAPAAAARVIVTFTRGLAVMERVGNDRNDLMAMAQTFVAALIAAPVTPPNNMT